MMTKSITLRLSPVTFAILARVLGKLSGADIIDLLSALGPLDPSVLPSQVDAEIQAIVDRGRMYGAVAETDSSE